MSPGKRDDHWAASKTSKVDATKFRRRRIPGNVASHESETDEIFLTKISAGGDDFQMTKIVVIYVDDAMADFRLHRIKNSLGDPL